jgi:hypothetical protein
LSATRGRFVPCSRIKFGDELVGLLHAEAGDAVNVLTMTLRCGEIDYEAERD